MSLKGFILRPQRESDHQDPRWLPQFLWLRDEGKDQPLYCIHHSGGDVGIYRKLVRHLDRRRPVIGIQSRLLTGSIDEFPNVDQMAEHYACQIMHHQPQGEISLLGFSFGGFVANAIAHYLNQHGRDVSFLGLIDSDLRWANDDSMRSELALRLTQVSLNFQRVGMLTPVPIAKLERDVEEIADNFLGDFDASPAAIVRDLERRGHTTRNQEDGIRFARFVIRFTTHLNMVRRFRPHPRQGDLHLWWPTQPSDEKGQRTAKWRALTTGAIRESVLEGSHFTLLKMPTARVLAQQIDGRVLGCTTEALTENLMLYGSTP